MKKIIILLALALSFNFAQAQVPDIFPDGIILGSFATDPTGYRSGQLYYNTTDLKIKFYNGTAWSDLGDGDFIPLSGTWDTGNPVTGRIDFSNDNLMSFSSSGYNLTQNATGLNLSNGSSGIRFGDNLLTLETSQNSSNYVGLILSSTGILISDNGTPTPYKGLEGLQDYSLIEPTNKLIYTQRQYVDDAVADGTSEWASYTGTRLGNDLNVVLGETSGSTAVSLKLDESAAFGGEAELKVGSTTGINIYGNPAAINMTAANGVLVNGSRLTLTSDNGATRVNLQPTSLTDNRTITFPDADGRLALLSDTVTQRLDASIVSFTNLDWSAEDAIVYTLIGTSSLLDINLPSGTDTKIKELYVTGDFSLSLPSTWIALPSNDFYAGKVWNHIVISCINGNIGQEIIIYSLTNL
jgi:hypothetical protein